MAWGARQENGVWRICERKGRTIINVNKEEWPDIEIRFSSQAMAQKCAHSMNELFWDEYRQNKKILPPANSPIALKMLEIIRDYGGLNKEDFQKIMEQNNDRNFES